MTGTGLKRFEADPALRNCVKSESVK